MSALRASLLLAVVALFATGRDAPAAKAPGKEHTFHGRIVHVHHGKAGTQQGRITVRHRHNGKDVTKAFHVSAATTIRAGGANKAGPTTLHNCLHVAVRHHGHQADDILIHLGKNQKQ